MIRDTLLSIHLLAIIVWIGVGFFQLYLGRRFLAAQGTVLEAPLIRIVYRADLIVFGATMLAFAAGIGLTIADRLGFFTTLWLSIKQSIMLIVIAAVIYIFPTARRLGGALNALPDGPGPASDDVRQLYLRLEPWSWTMRSLAVCAVLVAVWRPG